MENIKKIKEVRKIEAAISQNLFWVSALVTLVTMGLMATNFFTRGAFLPAQIGFFYLSVVLIYSLHKEFLRWLGEKRSIHNGEYFVYAWILLTTVLYAVNFFSNNFYSFSAEGYPVSSLADISFTTMQVLGVFVLTRVMKMFFMMKK